MFVVKDIVEVKDPFTSSMLSIFCIICRVEGNSWYSSFILIFFVKHVAGTDLQCGLCAGGVSMLS